MLFVELALIRWLGSNMLYLSYFSNFVLLASFLGIGIGFLWSGRGRPLLPYTAVGLAMLTGIVTIFQVNVEHTQGSIILVGSTVQGLPPWVVLPVIFGAVAMVMATIGDAVARLFRDLPSLDAYRLDIIGSICGILGFTLLSFVGAPPVAWGGMVATVLVILQWRHMRHLQFVALVALVAILGHESLIMGVSWSPYYKVQVTPAPGQQYDISVNAVPFQLIQSVADVEKNGPAAYTNVYSHLTHPVGSVLVIGAGNGKDVAIALAHGATHVDAVEIDPRIQQIGAELNPDKPYADPRVSVYIDDGRAFLERSTKKYNLIILALTDSLTVVSGQSALRLESYLFTREAIATVNRHLTDDGVFAAYNYYWQQWYADRLANTMQTEFGRSPCFDVLSTVGTLEAMSVSRSPTTLRCATTWPGAVDLAAPVTDDYPFAYLRTPEIPSIYLLTLVIVLTFSLLAVIAVARRPRELLRYTDLFFMGAAFLLLETKSVVQFALLFGTTWLVNALVFFGVLVSVLVAIEFSRRVLIKRLLPVFALLAVALAIAWLVPVDSLLALDFWPRLGLAIVVQFAPITVANIIFAQRFRDVESSVPAFASNLLGAMLGGTLEYTSLIIGYRNLIPVIALLYVVAMMTGRRTLRAH